MTTAPASAIETRPPRRRGWGQFSLVSLLLLAVIGCLVGAYIAEVRRRQAAESLLREKDAEIRQNRIDLGLLDDQPNVLTIIDPTKVYIRHLPWQDPRTAWRWRVYLPPRTQWKLHVTAGDSMDDSGQLLGSGGGTDLGVSGEFTLEGRLVRHLNGRPYVELRWGKRNLSSSLPDSGVAILESSGKRTLQIAGQKAQETFDSDAVIELVRQYVKIPDDQLLPEGATAPRRSAPSREFGISVRFEKGSLRDELKNGQSMTRRSPPSN